MLPSSATPAELWDRFRCEAGPALGMLLLAHVRLREIHTHGWTLAAPASWLPALAERLPQLEGALARVYGGSPKAVHLAELGQ